MVAHFVKETKSPWNGSRQWNLYSSDKPNTPIGKVTTEKSPWNGKPVLKTTIKK